MQDVALRRGDLIPHFETTTIDGRPFRYADVWQRSNLVLFVLRAPAGPQARAYLTDLQACVSRLTPANSTLVAVRGPVPGLPESSVLLSDQWGEIAHIGELPADVSAWPEIGDIVEWLEFVRMKCPECPA